MRPTVKNLAREICHGRLYVRVIRSQGGDILEQGAAVKGADGLTWTYTTTTALQVGQAVSIDVTGTDKPGNTTLKAAERG